MQPAGRWGCGSSRWAPVGRCWRCRCARTWSTGTADSAFAFACNSYNRTTVAAGAEIRFRRPTRRGEELVASAVERSREGRDGVYDVTVVAGETVVAEFVGRSREVGGSLVEEQP
jgi:acyl-CoA thioesterase